MNTHFKIPQLIEIYNGLAKRKGVKPIPTNTRMSFNTIADMIEDIQHVSVKHTPPAERRHWLLRLLGVQ
jgi:hypothetical protein